MKILSHRGYWRSPSEKNTEAAFARSFQLGFGTETDVRDHNGELVISHDPPEGRPMLLAEFLAILAREAAQPLPLAINVKADGLAGRLARQMASQRHPWFVFDMSVPDLREQLRAGNPVYARLSEFEELPDGLAADVRGVWLDAFLGEWYTPDAIRGLLDRGLDVCVVSSELHGRDPSGAWDRLASLSGHPRLSLCTDEPERASERFNLPSSPTGA